MSYNTLAAILKGKWLIEPISAKNYLPLVANVLKGTTQIEQQENILNIGIVEADTYKTIRSIGALAWLDKENIAPGSTIVIPVQGALMKADQFCGPVGMMNLAALTNELSKIDNVSTIVFDIDSPGGQVDGTQTLAAAIKNSNKKTIAFVNDGMACSAAYWIGSSCDEFYVSKKTDVVGSIGVYCTLADFKAFYESEGLPIHEIYSRKSGEKNKDYKDAMKGEYDGVMDDLDYIANEFIAAVKENRKINLLKGDPFKGATYFAEQAAEIGLIDGIKTFEEILNTKIEMKDENKEAIEVNNETVAGFINGLNAEKLTVLNTLIKDTKRVVMSTDELQELETLRTWKAEHPLGHTVATDKDDEFGDRKDEDAELAKLKAKEADVLKNEFGIEI